MFKHRGALLYSLFHSSWISWFLASKGNEYFCEIEEDYILDRFKLTGLAPECVNYSQALDLITDNLGANFYTLPFRSSYLLGKDEDIDDELRQSIEVQARFLYGLIHARWIITSRGLAKMVEHLVL